MGKNTNAKEATKKSVLDLINDLDGNISDNLASANSMEDEVREMAESKMKEEEKKEKADELVRITKRAVYTNIRLKIDAQYTKKCGEIVADARNKSLDLLNQLKEGKLSPVKYADELSKMVNEQTKEIVKAGDKRREDMKELNNSYVRSGYWDWSWDNPFNTLNRAIERNKNN